MGNGIVKVVPGMIMHFMILSSSYSTGTRIAMHYIIDVNMNTEMLLSEMQKIKEICGETVSISTHKKLLYDKIYAFKYGPVIESVYEKYKGTKDIEEELTQNYEKMPARSRILFAEDGIAKISYIDQTLKTYGKLSASKLIDITHVIGGPWDSVEKGSLYAEIPDHVILEKHHIESALL